MSTITRPTPISCCAIIPARFGSTRFPGKPLAQILGKPMIQRTYESALRCPQLERVWIATDSPLIAQTAESFGAPVIMTSAHCANGTERILQALQQLPEVSADACILNIQGDEPLIEAAVIEAVLTGLVASSSPVSTASVTLTDPSDFESRSVVKCLTNTEGKALYFTRSPVAHWTACLGNRPAIARHIGIYGYRRWFLELYGKMAPSPLQVAEDLEQLRVLEHGYSIQVMPVSHHSCGVDTPEDIAKVEKILLQRLQGEPCQAHLSAP
jgi:3-deoxy-manno-octulosonate cytidylyltransferase (CMP-KDO synthetase)